MGELEEKLSAILNDPGEMSKITQMARSLFGDEGTPDNSQPQQTQLPEMPDPRLMSALTRLMSGASVDGDSHKLLEAMKPYLAEKRRNKMDKAMKIARLAKMAKLAIGELGGDDDDGI